MKLLLLIFQCYFKKFEVYDYWESGCLNGIYIYATNYIICVTNAYINYPLPSRGPINQHHIGMSCLGTAAGDLKLVRSLCTWPVNVNIQPVNKWNVMKIGWKCTWRAFCKFVITWNEIKSARPRKHKELWSQSSSWERNVHHCGAGQSRALNDFCRQWVSNRGSWRLLRISTFIYAVKSFF